MVWQDLKPRDIITAGAVRNAVQMVLAVSGSINCVKHLQAIATEAEVDVDVYQTFAEYAERVPLLAAVQPNGTGHIEDFEAAGGARARAEAARAAARSRRALRVGRDAARDPRGDHGRRRAR